MNNGHRSGVQWRAVYKMGGIAESRVMRKQQWVGDDSAQCPSGDEITGSFALLQWQTGLHRHCWVRWRI